MTTGATVTVNPAATRTVITVYKHDQTDVPILRRNDNGQCINLHQCHSGIAGSHVRRSDNYPLTGNGALITPAAGHPPRTSSGTTGVATVHQKCRSITTINTGNSVTN